MGSLAIGYKLWRPRLVASGAESTKIKEIRTISNRRKPEIFLPGLIQVAERCINDD